jgi:hypothetical protein
MELLDGVACALDGAGNARAEGGARWQGRKSEHVHVLVLEPGPELRPVVGRRDSIEKPGVQLGGFPGKKRVDHGVAWPSSVGRPVGLSVRWIQGGAQDHNGENCANPHGRHALLPG